MVTIIPAILATTEEEFSQQLKKIKSSSALAEGWVHIDFMDGKFVENQSIDPEMLKNFDIPYKKEAHLMITHPVSDIDKVLSQKFDRVIIHLESEPKTDDTPVDQITYHLNYIEDHGLHTSNLGVESGLAINPESDINQLSKYLKDVNVVQIMGVVPGAQGHDFLVKTYQRVQEVAQLRSQLGLKFQIAVDGGVSDQNARQLVDAGADILVIGSYLQKGDIDENLEKIWEIVG